MLNDLNDIVAIVRAIRADKKGVTALEYGLIASLIAVAIIAAFGTLSTAIQKTMTTVANSM